MQMLPFLTRLDSRAAIKGSRDPLGVQGIWTKLGRQVVGNLTTVSDSVTDFTVLLLGYYFAERVFDAGGSEGDLATFLKWEQLAGYGRARADSDDRFRGTERVHKRLNDGGRVKLGLGSDAQILSNQKIYGLWGLYSVPARTSGLLAQEARLSAEARDAVERLCLPGFGSNSRRVQQVIVDLLRDKEPSLDLGGSRDQALLDTVAGALKAGTDAIRRIYDKHLVCGGKDDATKGIQRAFAKLLVEASGYDDWTLNARALDALVVRLPPDEVGEEVAVRLRRIRTCELLLAPAVALFEFVLGFDGQTPPYIADKARETWADAPSRTIDVSATEAIQSCLAAGADAETGVRWLRLARALNAGAYEEALHLLLEQNCAVMKARSAGSAWASVENGKLSIRFRDEQAYELPSAQELPTYWRHAYFIESLRRVAFSVRGSNA